LRCAVRHTMLVEKKRLHIYSHSVPAGHEVFFAPFAGDPFAPFAVIKERAPNLNKVWNLVKVLSCKPLDLHRLVDMGDRAWGRASKPQCYLSY